MDSFVFLGFGLDAWITIVTVFAMFTVLLFTKIRSDVVFLSSVSTLYVTGSPTHMLVYGPGGYRFSDFLKIGLLMNLIILVANILIVNLVYPLTPLQ